MDGLDQHIAPRGYGSNATYVYEYSRGLNGVHVPRDVLYTRIILGSLLLIALVIFCGRIAQISHAYLRFITSLSASRRQQTFWSVEASPTWARLKKHVMYAPLGRKRHNREIQLSSAVNIGTLPSRFQAVLIFLYVASQIAYCATLDYRVNKKEALFAELRGRSGTLAVLNMVPLFIFAGRNNPFISLLRVSFDTYNLLHRWLGRIVVLESVVHTAAWAVNACNEQGFNDMLSRLRTTPFFTWGLLGTCSMVFLCLHSPSPIRHAFYETFLHLHQLAALLAFLGVYVHLDLDNLYQKKWATAIAVIWLLERSVRLGRLLYLNVSIRHGATKLVVEALPGEACRVTFHLPRRVRVNPGSHVYAYIPSRDEPLLLTHRISDLPFPSRETTPRDLNTYLEQQQPRNPHQPTSVSLIITARQGMTRSLYNRALAAPAKTLRTTGYIEGPYAARPVNFASYGTTVLFSAGAGITHHTLYVRDLILRAADGCVATQQIHLVWSVRNTEHLTWVREWMDSVLRLPGRRDILTVRLFVSKPRSSREIVSPSSTVQMLPGRCRPDVVLDEILPGRVGATLVSVCGPGAFSDEVRAAARGKIGSGPVVDFVEEAFTW
ncbi:hypothetical protein P168DRAFT_314672 [Aspergillus campestris IBT 28561]|uniref:FAD-binding FR-type domain-containing protein n=1 Tax=Aspergillus campestris (strain IBT 28561) TaxID=1392248 RepID=A0A2I1DFF0_ASPC2|nr:uncharacterized protein P168DRAFT_314672 [Aspergillus campestris IBT 28561]PKY08599.1 hypothetical protein P168DRAFT_314672 [Aspergillus campestris IBT 28561]